MTSVACEFSRLMLKKKSSLLRLLSDDQSFWSDGTDLHVAPGDESLHQTSFVIVLLCGRAAHVHVPREQEAPVNAMLPMHQFGKDKMHHAHVQKASKSQPCETQLKGKLLGKRRAKLLRASAFVRS
eukprot:1896758-Amphidinium_carterae.1